MAPKRLHWMIITDKDPGLYQGSVIVDRETGDRWIVTMSTRGATPDAVHLTLDKPSRS